MGLRIRRLRFSVVLAIAGLAVLAGCARKPNVQALFTRPELLSRGRLAVLGLTPEQEQIFMASYVRAFPGQIITFVERNRLKDILGEQDLLKGRLDDNTRAKIKRILGVEALIMCTYYDDEGAAMGGKKLRVRIVDSETGAILGSVITLTGDNFAGHCDMAVQALKNDVLGKNRADQLKG
jgi:hypothetical protein